jgi:uncharacterized protein YcaQ
MKKGLLNGKRTLQPTPQRVLSATLARRLAVMRQRLAGPHLSSNASDILDVVRDIGCLQIDPIRVVAPSHLLVLWSRLGNYDVSLFESLLWNEHKLFENWAHATSIVLTEDYPIFSAMMHSYGTGKSAWSRRFRDWVKANSALRRHILTELRRKGTLSTSDFEDKSVIDWRSGGWTTGRNVHMMLTFLWAQGKIMVAGRSGGQKMWALSERWLPEWTPRDRLSWKQMVYRAAQKSLRALGVATSSHIERYYIRGCYPGLSDVLTRLRSEGLLMQVRIVDSVPNKELPGTWIIHSDDLPLLDKLSTGDWEPRTTLLSPFDNLVVDRRRTEQLFGFKFSFEIYVPQHKRQYGYYVMPILHGDQLIGRIDPIMNREKNQLNVNAVYAEPHAPMTVDTAHAIAGAIEKLGAFLHAEQITFSKHVPEGWRNILH